MTPPTASNVCSVLVRDGLQEKEVIPWARSRGKSRALGLQDCSRTGGGDSADLRLGLLGAGVLGQWGKHGHALIGLGPRIIPGRDGHFSPSVNSSPTEVSILVCC